MAKHLQKAAALEQRLAKLADDHDAGEDQEEFLALSRDVKKKLKSFKSVEAEAAGGQGSGVIYLGHIPHGFYEEQMRAFFGQFGDVKRVRLSRSTKTAKSRGYAFVEFEEPEVAQIVAETMNGYYLSGRKLVCEVVPLDKLHPDTFNGANHKFFKVPWRKLEKERRARPRTEKVASKCLSGLLRTEKARRQRIADAGIDYEFPGFEAQADVAYVRRKRRLEGAKCEEEDGGGKSMVEKGGGGAARPSKRTRNADAKLVEGKAKGKAKDGTPRSATVQGKAKGKEGNKVAAATAVAAAVPVPLKAEAGAEGRGQKGKSKAEVSKAASQRVSKAPGPASSKATVNASNVDVRQKSSSQEKAESSMKRKRPSDRVSGGDKPSQQQQQQTKTKVAQQSQSKKQKAQPQVKKLKPVAENSKPIAVTEKKGAKPKASKKQKK